jgi:hypothetical protein
LGSVLLLLRETGAIESADAMRFACQCGHEWDSSLGRAGDVPCRAFAWFVLKRVALSTAVILAVMLFAAGTATVRDEAGQEAPATDEEAVLA